MSVINNRAALSTILMWQENRSHDSRVSSLIKASFYSLFSKQSKKSVHLLCSHLYILSGLMTVEKTQGYSFPGRGCGKKKNKQKKVQVTCCQCRTKHNSLTSVSFQCQWAHIGGSLHSRTTAPFRIPNEAFWCVLTANLLYAATPVLVALRVQSNPYFFLKINPFPGQTGLPNSEEKDTKYKDK